MQVPAHLDVAATQAELRAGLPDVAAAAETLSRACDAASADPGDSVTTPGPAADGAPAAAHGRAAEPRRPDPNPNPAEPMPACVARAGREELEVVFLGTGASIPSKYRNVTGIYLHRFAAARPPAKSITYYYLNGPIAQTSLVHTCGVCLDMSKMHLLGANELTCELKRGARVVRAEAWAGHAGPIRYPARVSASRG